MTCCICQHYFMLSAGNIRTDVNDQAMTITLEDVLQFVTGSRSTPAEGFDYEPRIAFDHAVGNRFPSANTCSCTLTLPVCELLKNEELSAQVFIDSLIGGQMFGLI
jgi:HECT-domain (ubiquitin-transferase)